MTTFATWQKVPSSHLCENSLFAHTGQPHPIDTRTHGPQMLRLASARVSVEFAGEVAAWALAAVPADADASSPIVALEPSFAALRAACKGPEAGPESKSGRVGKEAREVAVLSAAQKMCASRGFPAGLLERVFRDLHAGDVLDETAMKAWRDDASSAIGLEKIAGKEKALFETMELLQEFASDDEGAEDAA